MVKVVASCMVVPEAETPKKGLWLSNLDLVVSRSHTPAVYIYPYNGSREFFSATVLKASLSRALVAFYPFAGTLRVDQDGRLEVACTGEGALFVEAESESTLSEFGDFGPSDVNRKLLVPTADSGDQPLLLIQVTTFKCGGVCLGTAVHHTLADGLAALHFINSWSDLTRGGDIAVLPFLDRTLLRDRQPPSVTIDHLEYNQTAGGKALSTTRSVKTPFSSAIFSLSNEQIATLKRNGGGRSSLSTFRIGVAHVWRCACRARRLAPERETRLYMTADARGRVAPPLPPGYLGNAIFRTSAAAAAGEVASNPLEYGARKVQEATSRLDDGYVRSLVDFLELQEDVRGLAKGSWAMPASDLWVISWMGLPIYEADFGWGRPKFMGRACLQFAGLVYVLPAPAGDGGIAIAVAMESESMVRFREIFYGDVTALTQKGDVKASA